MQVELDIASLSGEVDGDVYVTPDMYHLLRQEKTAVPAKSAFHQDRKGFLIADPLQNLHLLLGDTKRFDNCLSEIFNLAWFANHIGIQILDLFSGNRVSKSWKISCKLLLAEICQTRIRGDHCNILVQRLFDVGTTAQHDRLAERFKPFSELDIE